MEGKGFRCQSARGRTPRLVGDAGRFHNGEETGLLLLRVGGRALHALQETRGRQEGSWSKLLQLGTLTFTWLVRYQQALAQLWMRVKLPNLTF